MQQGPGSAHAPWERPAGTTQAQRSLPGCMRAGLPGRRQRNGGRRLAMAGGA